MAAFGPIPPVFGRRGLVGRDGNIFFGWRRRLRLGEGTCRRQAAGKPAASVETRCSTANIVLTYRCVNRCPYCFSEQTRKHQPRTQGAELTLEEFHYYLALLRRGDNRRVNLLGGEPFVYRHIETVLDTILKDAWFQRLRIFTAGFIGPRFHRYLADRRVDLLINVNSPSDYPGDRYAHLVRSLQALSEVPARFWLGYNIYREDFDYQPVVALAHRLGVPKLRWTIANPSVDGGTRCLDPDGRRRVIPRLLEFLRATVEAGLEPTMDCPLEPCLFSDAQLGEFLRLCPTAMAELGKCGPVIDLAPGYQALRCFAAGSAFAVDVRPFTDIRQIEAQFLRTCDSLRAAAAPPECRQCRFLRSHRCDGGCVAARYQSLLRLQAERSVPAPAAAAAPPGPAATSVPATTSGSASSRWAHEVAKLAADGAASDFVRAMREHADELASTPGTRRLWARYYLHAGDRVQAARLLRQSLHEVPPHSDAAQRLRSVLHDLEAEPFSGTCQSLAARLC